MSREQFAFFFSLVEDREIEIYSYVFSEMRTVVNVEFITLSRADRQVIQDAPSIHIGVE